MIALFVFADGNTKLLDIPHANPYYYFPVMRGNFRPWAVSPEELNRMITVEKLVLRRVGADRDFVFYEESNDGR